jgi:pectate lyase
MTLAGQTAPGDGITLRNHGTVVSNTHDVVIQYMRFRTGDSFVSNHDTLSVFRSHDVMIDHVSASWGIDETLPVANSTNVTVQWSFITEGLHDSFHYKGPHSAGTLKYDGDVSFHHNLFAHHMWRSPLVRQNTDLVNNVIYDWGAFGTMVGSHTNDQYGPTSANVVNNYYVAGPSTEDPRDMFLGYAGSSVFASGNVLDVNLNGVRDGAAATYFQGQSRLVSGRFDFPSVPTQDALTAYQSVINEAGASLVRDAVDERIVAEVESDSGGIIDSPHDVGGWPVLFSEPAPLDSDRDGLPDAWENSFGRWYLDSDDASDGRKDQNADGTTNLEEYLQFLSDGGSVESLGGATTSMSSTTVSMSDFQLSMRQATANDWRNIINQLYFS